MNGIELSKAFYRDFGEKMLREEFPGIMPLICTGFVGSGSECFGFDDEISHDHDYEPGFCIFVPKDKIDRRTLFLLERAYFHLPREYAGFRRSLMNPVGGKRNGVIEIEQFYTDKCGKSDGDFTNEQWLCVPEYALAETVNGEVFFDGYGKFTKIRKRLKCYPDDIRKKKLAGYILKAEQSGQYNYERCIRRGDTAASQLCIYEFTQAVMHIIFLFNRRYMPYYKWSFCALKSLPKLGNLYDSLEYLISSDNTKESSDLKTKIIEDICAMLVGELKAQSLTDEKENDLEKHAYSVNRRIGDEQVRNLNIFVGV